MSTRDSIFHPILLSRQNVATLAEIRYCFRSGLKPTKRLVQRLEAILKRKGPPVIPRKVTDTTSRAAIGIPDRKTSYLYFIVAENAGKVKIGRSRSPGKRIRDLQAANHQQLVVLGIMEEGNPFSEREVHNLFNHISMRNEWFSDTPELRAFISKVCDVKSDAASSYNEPPSR